MYRVKFSFYNRSGYYYTEWFETLIEAIMFVTAADETNSVNAHEIQDEEGRVI